jgi:hypothetical protein
VEKRERGGGIRVSGVVQQGTVLSCILCNNSSIFWAEISQEGKEIWAEQEPEGRAIKVWGVTKLKPRQRKGNI